MLGSVKLYADVHGMIALFIIFFALIPFFSATFFGLVLGLLDRIEHLVLMCGIDGALNKRRNGLSRRHGLCRDVLGKRVGDNRGRYGWDLHPAYSLCETATTNHYLCVINKHLIISCKRFYQA